MRVRLLYSLFFYILTPLILLKLIWRGFRAPAYRLRWLERFGWFPARSGVRPAIWVHAVSVGETLAALPLIEALLARYPDHDVVVTTMTPTGSDRVTAALGERVLHVYAPYDLPDAVGRFLRRIRPVLAIIMETELWPNTLHTCGRRGVPVILANARLSARSAAGYRRFGWLTRPMLQQLTLVAAQHQADAERFRQLGVAPAASPVVGSIKFDISLSDEQIESAARLRQAWCAGGGRPILLVASTHAGEDELILQSFADLLSRFPDLLLVLVPRHPERFEAVCRLCETRFSVQRRSSGQPLAASTQVLLGDTMGEMMLFFGACDLAFVGGSWVARGGHNMIEPAAWARPVLTGPSLFNFAAVAELLRQAGGLQIVETPAALTGAVTALLDNPSQRQQMGEAARAVADANRGALERLLGLIAGQLPQRQG